MTKPDGTAQSATSLVVTTPLNPDVAMTGVVALAFAVPSSNTATFPSATTRSPTVASWPSIEATGTDCGNGDCQPPFDLAFNFTQGNFSRNTSGSTGVISFPSPIAYCFPQFYTGVSSPPASASFTGPAGASLDPRVESSGRFSGDTTGYNGARPESLRARRAASWP